MPGERRTPAAPQWFADLLAHRYWVRRALPFPHIYARDVFTPDFYRRLTGEVERVRRDSPQLFSPRDAEEQPGTAAVGLSQLRDGPLAVFLSREWRDMIANVAGVGVADVTAALLTDPPGSPGTAPGNGYGPVWFPGDELAPDERRIDDNPLWSAAPGGREGMRVLSATFYLGDTAWQPGDGGETMLYGSADAATGRSVPPLGNSLVLFECTPRSWYAFAGTGAAECHRVELSLYRPVGNTQERSLP